MNRLSKSSHAHTVAMVTKQNDTYLVSEVDKIHVTNNTPNKMYLY